MALVGLGTVIQSLLMDVSPQGHAMIGALAQCAFNTANAIRPLAWRHGYCRRRTPSQTGYVSAALFLGGFLMWSLSAMQMKSYESKVITSCDFISPEKWRLTRML